MECLARCYAINMRDRIPENVERCGRLALRGLLLVIALVLLAPPRSGLAENATAEPLVVFAASSLAPPLDANAEVWERQAGTRLRIAYGSSAALARQIEQGAPAGLFLTAHREWLNQLLERDLIDPDSISAIARNRLVLAVRPGRSLPAAGLEILRAPSEKSRIAIGAPDSVPLGTYTQEAMTALSLWKNVEPRAAPAASARAAAAMVRAGTADYGILYASDALADDLEIAAPVPADSHTPIVYLGAVVSEGPDARRRKAAAFLRYLQGQAAQAVFSNSGFSAPESVENVAHD